ncbi:MAG: ABC transporter ATP-binding protein [Campylobacterota bacterium]
MKCELKKILLGLKEYKKPLILGNIIAVFAVFVSVPIPLLVPVLVDEVLLEKQGWLTPFIDKFVDVQIVGYVFIVLFLAVFLRGLTFLLNSLQTKLFTVISKDITYKLRLQALNHLKNVSIKEYELTKSGGLVSKLVVDIDTIDDFISSSVSKFIISILTIIGIGIVLLWIHWQLALFIMVLNPAVIYFTRRLAANVSKLKAKENKATEVFQASLSETLELFTQIKATNKEKFFFKTVDEHAKEIKTTAINFGYKSDLAERFSQLLFLSGYELFRAVSILAVAYSDLSVGLMLAIFGYLWFMMPPIHNILSIQYAFHNAKAACERVNDLFAMEKEPHYETKVNPFEDKEGVSIETKGLDFSYIRGKKSLDDIDLKVDQKQKVGIIGGSGSGKTTLASVLVGLYPTKKDTVFYNGIDIHDIGYETVRANVHMVLQNPKLFNDTLLFNITLGKQCSQELLHQALKIAQLQQVVADLEDGLHTPVGHDGVKLSGGQRQRVAIARMVVSQAKIIILDESTSALDIHTESRLYEMLERYLSDKTVIVIAHRLTTVEKVDKVYLLEEGKIVDFGNAKEIISKYEGI